MAKVWRDPVLPKIIIPTDLEVQQFRLGSARYTLLPKQYEFAASQEEFTCYMGGLGSGKTRVGLIKAALLSMWPNNRGIVGRLNSTDLEDTAQRDLLEFLQEAELLKEAPNTKNRRAIVYCVDPATGENLGYTSEISFQHLDDPWHLKGRHIGWFWIDEASECDKLAWQMLVGRLRLPTFRDRYKGMATGNPEGRNWLYDMFFNEEIISSMICGLPTCKLSDKECNLRLRRKRRGIHAPSKENIYAPPEYLENMISSYSKEEQEKYLDADFETFVGQIYKEFSEELHVVTV